MNKLKKLACMLIATCFFFLPTTVLAKEPSGYVSDFANVIDQDVENKVATLNQQLEAKNGGQIFVVTVDFLDGKAIDDYAYEMFNDWGIGSAQANNGVLLLLAIGEDNYYCLQGSGLEYDLSSSSIKRILNNYLEEDFAAGNYSDGVMKTVDQLYQVVYATAGVPSSNGGSYYPNNGNNYYPNNDYQESRGDIFSGIFSFIFFMIIFSIILSSIFRPRRRIGGYYPRRNFFFFGNPYMHHHHHHHSGPRPPFGGGGFGGGAGRGGGFHGGGGGGSRGGGAGR